MNFDLDDPLGSDDSFFEEPKVLSKRSAKPSEKKSNENAFNLIDVKENVNGNKSMPEISQKVRSTVTFDESTIKHDEFSKFANSELSGKVQKKKSDDWLGDSENINVQEKKAKSTDFLEDLLYGRSTPPKEKKTASFEDTQKDSRFNVLPKPSSSMKEPTTPTEVMSNFSILSNISRERRKSRRGSSSGFEDALGLFREDYQSGDFQSKETKSITSTPATTDIQSKFGYISEKGKS